MAHDLLTITPEEADAMLAASGTAPLHSLLGRGPAPIHPSEVVIESGPLTLEHVAAAEAFAASGEYRGVQSPAIKKIRHSHHRLAQFLAMGMREGQAGVLCGYTENSISQLKHSPAFMELVAVYAEQRDEAFSDFVETSAALSIDMVEHLRDILDTSPEKITPTIALEAIKVLADRTGHAPVQKSVNVNVNADLGARLARAKERLGLPQ